MTNNNIIVHRVLLKKKSRLCEHVIDDDHNRNNQNKKQRKGKAVCEFVWYAMHCHCETAFPGASVWVYERKWLWMSSIVLSYAMYAMLCAPCTTTTSKALSVIFKKLLTYFFDYFGSVTLLLCCYLLPPVPPNQFNARWALVMYLYMGELMTEFEK